MKETRSSKSPKNRSEIMNNETWIYFMSNCENLKKGRERSFLWMEHKRWRKTPAFF